MDSGRVMFNSAVPCSAGGGKMLLFGGGGGFLGGSTVVAGGEDRRRKRTFLTTHEELELQLDADEVYGALEAPERKRRLTEEQVRVLELSFEEEKVKLEPERKSELAQRLGMTPRQVAVWFQNRRARWKGKQLEQDVDRLRAAHGELLAGRDALLADNDRLRSQVTSLTKKLQAKEQSSSPEPVPAEQTAVPAAHTAAAVESVLFQHEESLLYTETITNGGAMPALPVFRFGAGGANENDSPESYFVGARSPPSSSEDDCGDDHRTFFLPDATLVLATLEHATEAAAAAEEEAQLNSWAWLWN